MALLRAILRRSWDEWEWIEKAAKVKMYREVRRPVLGASHLGKLAHPERHADVRPEGDGWLEDRRHGAALRTPGPGPDVTPRGSRRRGTQRHKFDTNS